VLQASKHMLFSKYLTPVQVKQLLLFSPLQVKQSELHNGQVVPPKYLPSGQLKQLFESAA